MTLQGEHRSNLVEAQKADKLSSDSVCCAALSLKVESLSTLPRNYITPASEYLKV